MEIIIGILIVLLIIVLVWKKPIEKTRPINATIEPKESRKSLNYNGAYKQKWLFTYNEKNAYYSLKEITDKFGLHLFAKVRLLDLLEPVPGNKKYKTFFYKVQAKHVDFVICANNLVAKCIVELDDSSHDKEERKERDHFVDEILTNVNYKIIHTRTINQDIEEQIKRAFGIT